MLKKLTKLRKSVAQTAKLMIGIPDYDNYLRHMREHHPECQAMSYAEFFRERQDARYGGKGKGGFRCC